jgi:hypothetical protein
MKALIVTAMSWAATADGAVREWRFDVTLDGRPIGEHSYVLREDAGARELTSEARFNVRILFFDAYRYEHRARELWHGDCLQSLDARTDTNGRQSVVEIASPPEPCVQTFAYWNPRILDAQRLLNPQTGQYVSVTVTPMGREQLAGRETDRFRLRGDGPEPLEIDLWYTPERDWVALESVTPEGRRVRYARK